MEEENTGVDMINTIPLSSVPDINPHTGSFRHQQQSLSQFQPFKHHRCEVTDHNANPSNTLISRDDDDERAFTSIDSIHTLSDSLPYHIDGTDCNDTIHDIPFWAMKKKRRIRRINHKLPPRLRAQRLVDRNNGVLGDDLTVFPDAVTVPLPVPVPGTVAGAVAGAVATQTALSGTVPVPATLPVPGVVSMNGINGITNRTISAVSGSTAVPVAGSGTTQCTQRSQGTQGAEQQLVHSPSATTSHSTITPSSSPHQLPMAAIQSSTNIATNRSNIGGNIVTHNVANGLYGVRVLNEDPFQYSNQWMAPHEGPQPVFGGTSFGGGSLNGTLDVHVHESAEDPLGGTSFGSALGVHAVHERERSDLRSDLRSIRSGSLREGPSVVVSDAAKHTKLESEYIKTTSRRQYGHAPSQSTFGDYDVSTSANWRRNTRNDHALFTNTEYPYCIPPRFQRLRRMNRKPNTSSTRGRGRRGIPTPRPPPPERSPPSPPVPRPRRVRTYRRLKVREQMEDDRDWINAVTKSQRRR